MEENIWLHLQNAAEWRPPEKAPPLQTIGTYATEPLKKTLYDKRNGNIHERNRASLKMPYVYSITKVRKNEQLTYIYKN